jgi:galactoside O-acetyltransferase
MTQTDCPSAFRTGALLTDAELRRWLKKSGHDVKVHTNSRIFPSERVEIGDFSQLDEGVFIYAGRGVRVGSHVHLAHAVTISGGGECVIEDFAGIGIGVRLVTGTEEVNAGGLTNPTIPKAWRKVSRGRVHVGEHALVFTGSIVLPNVTIGVGAVVSAGSLVHRDLKPWGIYAGNPLVQIGTRDAAPVIAAARAAWNR